MENIQEKKCLVCQKIFTRRGQNFKWWNTASFCSRDCSSKRQITIETRKKMSDSSLGHKRTLGMKFNLTDIEREKRRKQAKEKFFKDGKLISNPHTEKWYSVMKEKMSGENNWRWLKDRAKLKVSEKKHLDSRYKEWMIAVKNRDNWTCRIADVNCDGHLEAHHILTWKNYPGLRYNINNGITLCHAHHPRKKEDVEKLSPYFNKLVTETY